MPGNDEALTQEHRAKGKIRVDSFLNFHRNKSVVIFSDGSTDYESIGIGSCAAVLLPLLTTEDEILSTEAFSAFTDNTEAEVRGIASALDMAVHYFSSRSPRNVRDKLFILCDCLSAINIVLRRDDVDSHINVSERVRSLLHTLNNLDVDVTLGLIPGH